MMKQDAATAPIYEGKPPRRHIRRPRVRDIAGRNFFFAHPVLIRGMALAPALVASVDARNSLLLTIALLILTLPASLFASLARDRVPKFIRVPIYVLLAAAAYIPAYFLLSVFPYPVFTNLGVFLPLLTVSSFVYGKAEKESLTLPVHLALLDTLFGVLSFGIFAFILGSFREIFGAGHFLGIPLNITPQPGLLLPVAGFIIAGFAGAGLQFVIHRMNRRQREKENEQEENETGGEAL